MDVLPSTASQLSKKLRSKNVSTSEIYDISVRLLEGKIAVHFPKKEVFVLELLTDRWNNQRNTQFKRDPHMWQLFNQMWVAVHSDVLRKKIFRNLRYVPHLIQTLELEDLACTAELADALATNFELLNSSFMVEMSQDQAMAIIAGVLKIILHAPDLARPCSEKLLNETLKLTHLQANIWTGSINKLSQSFCSTLLPNLLQYSAKYQDDFAPAFGGLIDEFLFAAGFDSVKQISHFLEVEGSALPFQCYMVLYRECIRAVSKGSIGQLEQIFTMITKKNPSLASNLLHELSSLRKTLSQQFLETLFQETYQKILEDKKGTNDEYWTMVKQLLKLDIEVGIINTMKIMDAMVTTSLDENLLRVWETLIECYVNAREFPRLLDHWKKYCTSPDKSTLFVDDARLHSKITSQVSAMSATQIKAYFDTVVDEISQQGHDMRLTLKLLNVVLVGLYSMPYRALPGLEGSLIKLLEINGAKFPEYWTFTYHFLNIYDDILPEDHLTMIQSKIVASLQGKEQSSELFLTAMKLRELKEFDVDIAIESFMSFFRQSHAAEKRDLLKELFCRWSTILNLCFCQEHLTELIDELLIDENLELLDLITLSDDFYEETRIMGILTDKLCDGIGKETFVERLNKIPIQCTAKVTRVRAIDRLCSESNLSIAGFNLVSRLLSNPTFRSKVEVDISALEAILKQNSYLYQIENPIAEKVLANHISQLKDAVSEQYIANLTSFLTEKLQGDVDFTTWKLAFLLVKTVNFDLELSQQVQNTLTDRLNAFVYGVSDFSKDKPMLLWSLKVLYEIYQGTESAQLKESINSVTKNIAEKTSSENFDSDLKAVVFALFCCANTNEPLILLAHYMVLREHISKEHIYDAIEKVVVTTAANSRMFNELLFATLASVKEEDSNYTKCVLEILELLFRHIQRENEQGRILFSRCLSEINTHMDVAVGIHKEIFLGLLDTIKGLLVWKPWLFSQHTIEALFPLCLRVNAVVMDLNGEDNDPVFTSTTQLLSHILMYHRFKLTNRHHLVNSYMCAALEMLTSSSRCQLSLESAQSFSRFLAVFCEPSNDAKNNKNQNSLQSQVGQVKKVLRRHVSVLLLKYISLAIGSSFGTQVKECLNSGFFSVFDILSQAELMAVSASLGSPGRIYFKTLLAEYKRTGKWHEG
ncbi:LAME_0E12376g1_1 [Lachancea meyersii CBS 8951]|uniref:LAME_0E12376g1_1 n=1 Tax=Lachancea meyersii CBS 8951 TaxID=1266667 RepID=A0A1G4JLL4_9SACH|nr:LAME_0E12376g1_1 [Lachancea meyersii CBS 8951]